MKEGKFCVYAHINTVNNKVYIGRTSQKPTRRWRNNGKGYWETHRFYSDIKDFGWDKFKSIVLMENLSFEVSGLIERELIAKYNTQDKNCGYNMQSGGEDQRISCPEYSERQRKIKIDAGLTNKVININTGEIYESLNQASKHTGINLANLYHVCSGKSRHIGYDKNGLPIQWAFYQEGKIYTVDRARISGSKIPVICTTTGKIYPSMAHAARDVGISVGGIRDVLNPLKVQKTAGKDKYGNRLRWSLYEGGVNEKVGEHSENRGD